MMSPEVSYAIVILAMQVMELKIAQVYTVNYYFQYNA